MNKILSFIGIMALSVQAQAELAKPVVSRDANGTVTITGTNVRYSLDGSEPGLSSGKYLAPIALPGGGMVKARAFSEVAEAKFEPLAGATAQPSSLVPLTQSRDSWYNWEKRHAEICALVRECKPQLVFIGDSITHLFGGEPKGRANGAEVWKKYYGTRNALNLGYGWDRTENVIWRLQHGELDGATPKVAVLMIGTNNRDLNSPADIAAGVRAICAEIKQRSPQTKILLLAVFPRGAKPDNTRLKTDELNQLLAKMEGVTFLDIGAKFMNPDGSISPEIMGDYLHPTAKGYEIWAEAMEPTLRKMLGETDAQ